MPIRPLDGFTVGVTANRWSEEQVELLVRRGAAIVQAPGLAIRERADQALRGQTSALIERPPDAFVASTAIGVRSWFDAAEQWGERSALTAALSTAFVTARGAKAEDALHALELTVWWRPPGETSAEIVDHLVARGVAGRRVAVQLDGAGGLERYDRLVAAGAELVPVVAYEWTAPDDDEAVRALVEATCEGRVDAVTFTAAPTVRNVFAIAERHALREAWTAALCERVVCGCVGAVCAAAARAEGVTDPLVPPRPRIGSLVQALGERLASARRVIVLRDRRFTVQGSLAVIDGEAVRLSWRERAVFEALTRRPGAVIAKARLARDIWGTASSTRAVDTTVSRLRRRLGAAGVAIRTTRNRGYWIDAVVSDS